MAEHTQGKLRVNGWFIEAEGGPLGSTEIVADLVDGGRRTANARRLVAAWNLCEEFPTEVLENGIAVVIQPRESPVT